MNDTTPTTGARTSRTRNVIIAAVVVLAAGGWYGWHLYRAKASKDGEYIFGQVQKGDIEDLVTATGTLQPRDYVDVGAQVTGQIEKLYVDVGDEVKAGDKLASIDATQSQARVDADIASLKSSKTNLENQKNNLEKAKRDFQRQQNLLKEDATTQQAFLDAGTALQAAQNAIFTSQAQIDQQEANMRVEVQNLKYTTIIAPISGTVMSLSVKQGQTINATQSAPTVLRIANLGTMTVQSDVSEADVTKLFKGIPVYFTTLGGNRRWPSTLKRIDPTPKTQNSVVLYNALFDVVNEGNTLMPSMTAQVYFINASATNVLTVPMAALQQGQQIARELAAKEKKEGKTPAGAPGAPPSAAGAPAGGPAAAGAATTAAATPAGGAAPAAAAAPGAKPADAQANTPGNPRANGQGAGQGAAGGGFGGQRPGGGGFGQNMTPEQREEMRKRFQEMRANGGAGGFGGGNFPGGGNFNRQGMGANAAGAGAPRRPAQRRTGTVMVKKADGTLEARRVVIGVTNRVSGQVLEGLKEGEEVVIGKHEDESAAPRNTNNNQNQQNQNRPQNFQGGGFPGGGFPGGGRF